MISHSRLLKNLNFLDRHYKDCLTSSDVQRPVLFSKLAVIELCGWLELCFDDIARNAVRHKLRTYQSRKILELQIERTYGFQYDRHFRPMLCHAMGIIEFKKFEKSFEKTGDLDRLKASLSSLKKKRNDAAHTFVRGATNTFDSPEVIIKEVKDLSPILTRMWDYVGS